MGFKINLPDAGLLGLSAAQALLISANTTGVANGVYVSTSNVTFTLPPGSISANNLNAGDTVFLKASGTSTISVEENAGQLIEGNTNNVTLSAGTFAQFIYLTDAYGWVRF